MQYEDLGKFIKLKRKELGLSLNRFAVETDIDPAILCRIENLQQGIKVNILKKIADAMHTTPSKFLEEFEHTTEE